MKTSKYLYIVTLTISIIFSRIYFAQTPLEIITESHTGGWSNYVAANQDNVFLLQSYSLRTMTFDGTTFSTVGSVTLPWTGLLMYPSGSDVFVGSDNNLARVDISNINGPSIITTASLGTAVDWINSIFAVLDKVFITQFNTYTKSGSFKILNKNDLSILGSLDIACQDVFVSGNTAYVITGHKSIGDSSQYLKIYNISNPSDITEISGIQLDGAEKVSISNGYAYVVGKGRNGLTVIDISNPVSPAIVADEALTDNLSSISISGNTAYIANAGNIYFVDITTPSNPVQTGNIVFSAYTYSSTVVAVGGQTKYLLCVQNGLLNSYNITNPQIPIEGPQNESPAEINTITITVDNMFCGDGISLWKSELNSDALTKYYTINNKIISSSGNNLFIVYDESNYSKLTILDISTINSPVQKGTYQSTAKIFKIAANGNYVFLLLENSKTIEVIDASNINLPVKIFTYQLTGNGTSLFAAKESETNILYAGYYDNENIKGIELIDISNPAALLKLSNISTGGNPNALHTDNNIIYVGSHTSNEVGWYLEAFNAANPQSPVLVAQTSKLSEGEIIWDIFAIKNNLAVSFAVSGLRTYELIQSSSSSNKNSSFIQTSTLDNSIAQTGTSSDVHYPKDIAAYQSGNDLNVFTNAGWWHPGSHYTADGSKGVYKVKVPKFIPAVESKKVVLTMAVNPVEAASDGCTVTPPVGTSEYTLNSNVTLDAKAAEGWVWDKWTGSVSGTGKPAELVMDDDKSVTGNFQPILVLSLNSPAENYHCPPGQDEELTIGTANIFVDGVDWQLSGLTFTSVEKAKADYTEAWIQYGSNKLQGNINKDSEGYITTISFSPSVIINEGTTLSVRFFYKFNLPSKSSEKYIPAALEEVMKYKISINVGQISCIPIPASARPGVKTPSNPFTSNTQHTASVWNVSREPDLPFASIKEAVESPQTLESDLIKVCPGWYTEKVEFGKSLTIFSSGGAESTVIEAVKSDEEYVRNDIFIIRKGNTKVSGFTFINGDYAIIINNPDLKVTSSEINNNIFIKNRKSINIGTADSNYIHDNTMEGMTIRGSYNVIEKNTIGVFNGDSRLDPGIEIDGDYENTAENNIIINNVIGGSRKAGIKLSDRFVQHTEIKYNKIGTNADGTAAVPNGLGIFLDQSDFNYIENNLISGNLGITYSSCGISLKQSEGNTIKNNTIGTNLLKTEKIPNEIGLQLEYSHRNIIEGNLISGNMCAISFKFDCDSNVVKNNTIGSNEDENKNLTNGFGVVVSRFCNNNLIENNVFFTNLNHIGIMGEGTKENIVSDNKIGTNAAGTTPFSSSGGIFISASNNTVSNNLIAGCLAGILIAEEGSTENTISNNIIGVDITGTKALPNGIGINLLTGTKDNHIENNLVSGNTVGILLMDIGTSNNWIQNNKIGVDINASKSIPNRAGIYICKSASDNRVCSNTVSGNLTAVFIGDTISAPTTRNLVRGNYIGTDKAGTITIPNKVGVSLLNCSDNFIVLNKIWHNETGVWETNGKNYLFQNDIRDNTGNTGVHLKNSFSEIAGNILTNDHTDAIKCENGSRPVIKENNIFNNQGYGLINTDPAVYINAAGNWWGDASGPSGSASGSGDKIQGNISYGNWSVNKIKLSLNAASDTLYIPENNSDSISIFYHNWDNASDKLNITISSDKESWIISEKTFAADLSESLSGESKIKFMLPAGILSGSSARVVVNAISQIDPSLTAADTFFVSAYKSLLTYFLISPDSIDCQPGDTIQFRAVGYDQLLNQVTVKASWSAEGGVINQNGRYITGEENGIFTITALENDNNLTALATVRINNSLITSVEVEEGSKEKKIKEVPNEYLLYQNYPNPFNPTTTISFGLPVTSIVQVEVYNILGERITQLVNEIKDAGYHQVEWNSSGLASGIYFYTIYAKVEDPAGGDVDRSHTNRQAGEASIYRAVKKMILLK